MSYISCWVKTINKLVLKYDHVHHQNHNTINAMHALILIIYIYDKYMYKGLTYVLIISRFNYYY